MKRSRTVHNPKLGRACAAAPPHYPSRAFSAGRGSCSAFRSYSSGLIRPDPDKNYFHELQRSMFKNDAQPPSAPKIRVQFVPIRVNPPPEKTKNYQTNPFSLPRFASKQREISTKCIKPYPKTNPFPGVNLEPTSLLEIFLESQPHLQHITWLYLWT